MQGKLKVYNSLTRKKEDFEPMNPPFVGMYVCGPTVYGDAHLGHARPAITFDVVYRFLSNDKVGPGYKVRYVRNITDVGHLENDADEGDDKIAKKARLEQVEPMEIVQQYSNAYHKNMAQLNTIPPSIEPTASGHIIEQIKMVQEILDHGYAYVTNGSVYFDVAKYNEKYKYGELSGRVVEELLSQTRELEGQEEKRSPADFALWKKAAPEHIMRWPSPWSDGFPGWHLECSVMSSKYLGETFDIHGGGMDLLFPHHECEIAQSKAATGKPPVRYWLHNNMITIQGQKMGKSLGNFITLNEFFSGGHELLEKAYTPMTIRFFMLQSHYRSTLDFSNEALKAAEKGYKRLMEALKTLQGLEYVEDSSQLNAEFDAEVNKWIDACTEHMNDDLNTALVLADLFELSSKINSMRYDENRPVSSISGDTFERLQEHFTVYVNDILGLIEEEEGEGELTDGLVKLLIEIRNEARKNKDYAISDKVRDQLKELNIQLKDEKGGTTSWSYIN